MPIPLVGTDEATACESWFEGAEEPIDPRELLGMEWVEDEIGDSHLPGDWRLGDLEQFSSYEANHAFPSPGLLIEVLGEAIVSSRGDRTLGFALLLVVLLRVHAEEQIVLAAREFDQRTPRKVLQDRELVDLLGRSLALRLDASECWSALVHAELAPEGYTQRALATQLEASWLLRVHLEALGGSAAERHVARLAEELPHACTPVGADSYLEAQLAWAESQCALEQTLALCSEIRGERRRIAAAWVELFGEAAMEREAQRARRARAKAIAQAALANPGASPEDLQRMVQEATPEQRTAAMRDLASAGAPEASGVRDELQRDAVASLRFLQYRLAPEVLAHDPLFGELGSEDTETLLRAQRAVRAVKRSDVVDGLCAQKGLSVPTLLLLRTQVDGILVRARARSDSSTEGRAERLRREAKTLTLAREEALAELDLLRSDPTTAAMFDDLLSARERPEVVDRLRDEARELARQALELERELITQAPGATHAD